MKKITDNLSRIVISLTEAKNEGIVMNILLDKKFKYILGYIIIDDNSSEEEEKFLPLKKVIEGTDAIMIVDETKLTAKTDGLKCPLNAPVYNTDGVLTGSLKDVYFDETTS